MVTHGVNSWGFTPFVCTQGTSHHLAFCQRATQQRHLHVYSIAAVLLMSAKQERNWPRVLFQGIAGCKGRVHGMCAWEGLVSVLYPLGEDWEAELL